MILILTCSDQTETFAGDCGTFSSEKEKLVCLWTLIWTCWTSHCPSWTWSWLTLGRPGVDWGNPSDNLDL